MAIIPRLLTHPHLGATTHFGEHIKGAFQMAAGLIPFLMVEQTDPCDEFNRSVQIQRAVRREKALRLQETTAVPDLRPPCANS